MNTPDKCRKEAAACYLNAQIDPNDRLVWLEMAQCWLQFAEHLGDVQQHSEEAQQLTDAKYPRH